MKNIKILLLLLISFSVEAFPQKPEPDSAALKIKIAKANASYFRLNKQARSTHRKHHLLPTSDYFKPTAITFKNSEWLNDSVYVKTYRTAAYQESSKQRTSGHNILVAGGVVVGAYLIAFVVFLVVLFN